MSHSACSFFIQHENAVRYDGDGLPVPVAGPSALVEGLDEELDGVVSAELPQVGEGHGKVKEEVEHADSSSTAHNSQVLNRRCRTD